MRRAVLLLPLLLGGCSCQRDPAIAESVAAAASAGAATDTPTADASAALAATPVDALAPLHAGVVNETITVRNYIGALLRGEKAEADGYWRSAPGSGADDAALRLLPQMQSIRVDTDTPIARDSELPSRLREVPVRFRATTAENGVLRYQGWYRLVPAADGSRWLIQSASIQPVLD